MLGPKTPRLNADRTPIAVNGVVLHLVVISLLLRWFTDLHGLLELLRFLDLLFFIFNHLYLLLRKLEVNPRHFWSLGQCLAPCLLWTYSRLACRLKIGASRIWSVFSTGFSWSDSWSIFK